jgi:predicted nucleic acid-binding protein
LKFLADTSALLALLWDDDERHPNAVDFRKRNPQARFILTELNIAELATRGRAKVGARGAVDFTRDLLRSGRYELILVDLELLQGALVRMERYGDKRLSLTDCASFELMERLGIDTAFTFDRDFRDCGFRMVP